MVACSFKETRLLTRTTSRGIIFLYELLARSQLDRGTPSLIYIGGGGPPRPIWGGIPLPIIGGGGIPLPIIGGIPLPIII